MPEKDQIEIGDLIAEGPVPFESIFLVLDIGKPHLSNSRLCLYEVLSVKSSRRYSLWLEGTWMTILSKGKSRSR